MSRVIYLLPGLMCDQAVWTHQAEVLERIAEVRIPVFRGFSSLREMAESVWKEAPDRFSVVGHSMGGRVALELMALQLEQSEALLNRKTIEHFAVMDSGAHGVQDGEVFKRQVLLDAAARKGLQAVADAWILPMLHSAHHADQTLIAEITSMILRNTVEDYRGQVKALLGRQERMSLLRRINQKVWLLCGDEDNWSPVSQHEEMLSLLPNAELRVIEQAGHMTTMEQPGLVNKLLLEWINETA